MDEMTVIELAVTAVPLIVAAVSMIIGSKQVREFHRRTGDDSVLSHITSFSMLREAPHADTRKPVQPEIRLDA